MNHRLARAIVTVIASAGVSLSAPEKGASEIQVKSTLDGESQPCTFFVPDQYDAQVSTPLVVCLHSWGGNYKEKADKIIPEARKRGWLAILPNYRNGNHSPKACGSKFAVQDIVDAVNYVVETCNVDKNRIYLVGGSGGGHMSLVMAAQHPEIWAAVSCWCPISDLKKFYDEMDPASESGKAADKEAKKFTEGIRTGLTKSCGGAPGISPEVDREYQERSPITFISKAKDVSLFIHHGAKDVLVAPHHGEDAYQALIAAGATNVTFNLHPGGHTIDMAIACDEIAKRHKVGK